MDKLRARTAGLFYLLNIVLAVLAAAFVGKLVVYGETALLAATACYVVVTVLFYLILKVVNQTVSLVAAIFSLVGCAVGVVDLFHVAALNVSSLPFFGVYCLLIGYLIFRSTFLPRILGALMAIAGLGWLTFVSPSLSHYLSPYVFIPGLIGEGALTVWLLVMGVKVRPAPTRSALSP